MSDDSEANGEMSFEQVTLRAPPARLAEGLTDANTIFLFGRPFAGLVLNPNALGDAGELLKLPRDSSVVDDTKTPTLARIYGFSWRGCYYKLPDPDVFLVYGRGMGLNQDEVGRENATVKQSLMDFRSQMFAPDIVAWRFLDLDYSVRININYGFLMDILLAVDAVEGNNMMGSTVGEGDLGGGSSRGGMVGRNCMVGRNAMVGRNCMVGRPPNS